MVRVKPHLHCEGHVDVAKGVPLAVDRADGDPPIVGGVPRKLRDVVGNLGVECKHVLLNIVEFNFNL